MLSVSPCIVWEGVKAFARPCMHTQPKTCHDVVKRRIYPRPVLLLFMNKVAVNRAHKAPPSWGQHGRLKECYFFALKRQNIQINLMAQMAFIAAMVMLLSASLTAGQQSGSDPCLNAGTNLVSDCSAFTSTLQSNKGFAMAGTRPSSSSSPSLPIKDSTHVLVPVPDVCLPTGDAALKNQTDQETQKNGVPSPACCSAIQSFSVSTRACPCLLLGSIGLDCCGCHLTRASSWQNGTRNCACDATIVAFAEGQYNLGSDPQQALLTTTRVGTYACTTKVTNGKPEAGTGMLPPATGCGGSPPSTPPLTKTAG